MPAIGGAASSWPGGDGSNAMIAHLSLDPATACMAALGLEFEMDARAAIAAMTVAMNPLDVLPATLDWKRPGDFPAATAKHSSRRARRRAHGT